MTEQPREREPSWLERLSEARRRMDSTTAERRARQACHAEAERRRVCAWQVSAPLWEAELQAHLRRTSDLPLSLPPGLKCRPPQTRPYDQETDR